MKKRPMTNTQAAIISKANQLSPDEADIFWLRATHIKTTMYWLAAFTLIAFLQACAVKPKEVWQKFTFDGQNDGWAETVDLLEYAYGDGYGMVQNSIFNPRNSNYKELSSLPAQTGINGSMPVGEFLYVKWRVRATKQIYEERIDLRQRLPANMADHGLTFVIDGSQLYAYVITPKGKPYGTPPVYKTWYSKSYYTYEIFPQLNKS